MPEPTIDMTPPPEPPLTFGHESRWKTVGRWALRIATFGLLARVGKLQPRDIVPALVAAAIYSAAEGNVHLATLHRVWAQIEAMAWDKATKEAAREQAKEIIMDRAWTAMMARGQRG